ncbi:MAG TPA: hypothetical protein VMM59_07200 [Thermohalobaculum sp.]|nr:hypothetical protein [Thermohalobaculum sp.]
MGITKYGLEAIGYKAFGPGETVKGTFMRMEVFSVQGFTLDAPCLPHFEERIAGVSFKFGFGYSLNEVCKLLIGDVFVDDEEKCGVAPV